MKVWIYFIGGLALGDLARLIRPYLQHYEPHGPWQTFDWWMLAIEMLALGAFGIILPVLALKLILTGKEE